MANPRHLLGAVLVFNWALMLSVRCLAAAVNSSFMGGSYEASLEHIGFLFPLSAWISLLAGIFLFSRSIKKDPTGPREKS